MKWWLLVLVTLAGQAVAQEVRVGRGTTTVTVPFAEAYAARDTLSVLVVGADFWEHPDAVAALPDFGRLRTLRSPYADLKALPAAVLAVRSLEVLDLRGNALTDWPAADSLPALQHLDLAENQLATVPAALLKLPNLRTLILADNLLEEIPLAVVQLGKLRALDLSGNEFERFPDEALYLPALERLDLQRNFLEAPPTVGHLPVRLLKLDLRENPLPPAARQRIEQYFPSAECYF